MVRNRLSSMTRMAFPKYKSPTQWWKKRLTSLFKTLNKLPSKIRPMINRILMMTSKKKSKLSTLHRSSRKGLRESCLAGIKTTWSKTTRMLTSSTTLSSTGLSRNRMIANWTWAPFKWNNFWDKKRWRQNFCHINMHSLKVFAEKSTQKTVK